MTAALVAVSIALLVAWATAFTAIISLATKVNRRLDRLEDGDK